MHQLSALQTSIDSYKLVIDVHVHPVTCPPYEYMQQASHPVQDAVLKYFPAV